MLCFYLERVYLKYGKKAGMKKMFDYNNPYFGGYGQPMQSMNGGNNFTRYGQPVQPNNNGFGGGNPNNNFMQNQNVLRGRMVTNIEEVKGILIEPDGNTYYFPCMAENCIYTKTIDLNAQSVINVFKLAANEMPVYADSKTVQNLNERLTNIEKMLLKGSENNVKSDADD